MGKRSVDPSPTLIEPDNVFSLNKRRRIASQSSAAMTLLSLRQGDESSISTEKRVDAGKVKKAFRLRKRQMSVTSAVTDDEDEVSNPSFPTKSRSFIPVAMKPPPTLLGLPPSCKERGNAKKLSAHHHSVNLKIPFVGRPLAAPPTLRLPPESVLKTLKPLSTNFE